MEGFSYKEMKGDVWNAFWLWVATLLIKVAASLFEKWAEKRLFPEEQQQQQQRRPPPPPRNLQEELQRPPSPPPATQPRSPLRRQALPGEDGLRLRRPTERGAARSEPTL